jgi:serine/threonine protein kinase
MSSSAPDPRKSAIVGPSPLPNGRLSYTVNGHPYEVPPFLNLVKVIGYGAYGLVCSAVHVANSKRRFAIKKVREVLRDPGDAKRVLREIKMQMTFNHENLLGLVGVYVAGDRDMFQDVYIVSELLDTDLSTVLRSKQKIGEEHVKYFVYQVLRGLKYMHTANIMHRDLKPANLLVNVNCDLRICDYGLSRHFDETDDGAVFTDYVVTRWYRPPELLLMNKRYTTAVDVWSVGCIFAEMVNRKPLFQGKDYLAQIKLICGVIGTPPHDDLAHLQNHEAVKYMEKMAPAAPKAMEEVVPGLCPEGQDFLRQMLQFDPAKRPSAAELMTHPYMGALHDPNDEPCAASHFEWDMEKVDLTRAQLRELFYSEALRFPKFLSDDQKPSAEDTVRNA